MVAPDHMMMGDRAAICNHTILDGSLTSVSLIVRRMVSALSTLITWAVLVDFAWTICTVRGHLKTSLSLDAGMRLAKRAQHGVFHVEDTHYRAIRTKGSVY